MNKKIIYPTAYYVPASVRNPYAEIDRSAEKIKETPPPIAEFEYKLELACSYDTFQSTRLGMFKLGKTNNEAGITSWKVEEKDGHTFLTASVHIDEPKYLYHNLISGIDGQLGVSSQLGIKDVAMAKQGLSTVNEAFIPVQAAVQVGERLGWPTEGAFYHFVDGRLVHEYRIEGKGSRGLVITHSNADGLCDEEKCPKLLSHILLPWKRHGGVVNNQHLLYRRVPLTSDEFAAIDDAWLAEHARKIDLDEILASQKQPVATREYLQGKDTYYDVAKGDTLSHIALRFGLSMEKLYQLNPGTKGRETEIQIGEKILIEQAASKNAQQTVHVVAAKDNDEGRECWIDIANSYGLTGVALLKMNPEYDDNPCKLKAGDTLTVKKPEPSCNTRSQVRKELPPVGVQPVTRWENTYYLFNRRMLADTVTAIHKPTHISHEHTAMAVVNVATVGQYSPQDLFFVFSE